MSNTSSLSNFNKFSSDVFETNVVGLTEALGFGYSGAKFVIDVAVPNAAAFKALSTTKDNVDNALFICDILSTGKDVYDAFTSGSGVDSFSNIFKLVDTLLQSKAFIAGTSGAALGMFSAAKELKSTQMALEALDNLPPSNGNNFALAAKSLAVSSMHNKIFGTFAKLLESTISVQPFPVFKDFASTLASAIDNVSDGQGTASCFKSQKIKHSD